MFREGLRPPDPFREKPPLEAAQTQDGVSIDALSRLAPVVVICLPAHDEAWLAAVAAQRAAVEQAGARVVLVHMGDVDDAALAPHDLQYVARVADPERRLYAFFELGTASPSLLRRALGRKEPIQLPGAIVLRDAEPGAGWRPETPDPRGLALAELL